jgi:MFS family permease
MLDGAFSQTPFRFLFAGRAVSAVGDRLMPVALAFAVLDLTDSPGDLGLVLAAQTIPLVLLVLFGGVWADRLRRERVMIASDLIRGVVQGITAALLISGSAKLWQLIVLQAIYGSAAAFFGPASTALVAQTVRVSDQQQANAILELTDSICSFVGPALAGVIIAVLNPGWGLAVDAATFGLGSLFLSRLRVQPHEPAERESTLASLRSGWRSFISRRWLWMSVLYFTIFMGFVYAPLQVLGPEVSRSSLGGPGAWAAISAALGVGALAGGLLVLRWKPRHPLRAGFLVFFGSPILIALIAAHASLAAILPVAAIDGMAGSIFNTLWFTAQQQYVPASEYSRVSSWDFLGTLAVYPIGTALAGPLSAGLGVSSTLYGATTLCAALTLVMFLVPAMRNFPEGAGDPVGAEAQ